MWSTSSELLIEYKMLITHAVARHCMSRSLCLVGRIHNGPPRKGLLKYVDLAENRDGSVGGGFLTSLVRKAKNYEKSLTRPPADSKALSPGNCYRQPPTSVLVPLSTTHSWRAPSSQSSPPRTSLTSEKGSLGQYSETQQGTRMVQWRSTHFASSWPETLP